tara:strand:+ start:279 stop:545 length:267 start_codon:yes stop_codon:yes gene_type:complete
MDVIGVGNPSHPANQQEQTPEQPETLQEAIDHYRDTNDAEPLKELAEQYIVLLESTRKELIQIKSIARIFSNTMIYNKLSALIERLRY